MFCVGEQQRKEKGRKQLRKENWIYGRQEGRKKGIKEGKLDIGKAGRKEERN